MAEYEVMEEDLRNYKEGEEVEVVVKDRETLEHLPLRAIIFKSADKLPDGGKLWVRSLETGVFKAEPWYIKVIEMLPYDEYARKKGG